MDESAPRHRAETKRRTRGPASRYIAFWLVAIVMVVMIAGILEAAPAQSQTSPRYQRLWDGLSDRNKRWARRTSECESGRDRNFHGGGGTYHGAFQFMRSTWRSAPKSPGGDPHTYSWRTQAVVAVYLKKKDGASTHWPSCG